jgi:hypothetical protein
MGALEQDIDHIFAVVKQGCAGPASVVTITHFVAFAFEALSTASTVVASRQEMMVFITGAVI